MMVSVQTNHTESTTPGGRLNVLLSGGSWRDESWLGTLPALTYQDEEAWTEIDGEMYYLKDTVSGGALADDPAGSAAVLDNAINEIASLRGKIGSFQKHTIDSARTANDIAFENLAEARSQIADADFATELATLNRHALLDRASLKSLSILLRSQDQLMELLS